MVFWGRIRSTRVECFFHQCKRWYSQIYRNALINDVAGWRRIGILENGRTGEHYAATRSFAAPVQAKPKPEAKDIQGPRLNRAITSEFVRLVTDQGHSVVSRHEALDRAMKLKLDLVEVQRHAKPPVCKIMDFHKEKYKQQLKEKDRLKSKSEVALRKGDCKEVRFTGKTEQKDLQMKADMVKRLMERGYRVKCMAMGTEEQDLGGLLSRLSAMIEDVAFVESGPRVEKRQAYVVVRHIKFGSTKKTPGKKAAKLVEATSSEVQKDATSPPKFASTSPAQIPLQIEEEWKPTESGSEIEDEILSDEEVDTLYSSETPVTTPIEEPKGEFGEKMTWSAFDVGDDFEKVFRFDSDSNVTTSTFTDNNTMHSVDALSHSKDTAAVPELLSRKLPFTSLVTGPDMNHGWNLESNTAAGPPGLKQMPDAVNAKPGLGNKEEGREFTRDNISSHLDPSLAGKNRYSGNELKASFRHMQLSDKNNTVTETKVSEFSSTVHRGQIINRDLGVNDLPRPKHQPPNPRWQPRPAVNATPSMPQNLKNTENSEVRNLKTPLVDESRKQPQVDAKQGPSLSSFGIFSAPKTAASSDPNTLAEVNRDKERNSTNPVKSPGSSGISSNPTPPESVAENPRQDADKTKQGGWGIFSKETSSPNQHRNSDSQMKAQR